jgi:hypothetical protein
VVVAGLALPAVVRSQTVIRVNGDHLTVQQPRWSTSGSTRSAACLRVRRGSAYLCGGDEIPIVTFSTGPWTTRQLEQLATAIGVSLLRGPQDPSAQSRPQ